MPHSGTINLDVPEPGGVGPSSDGESDEPRKRLHEQWSLLAGPHTFRGRAAGLPANGDDSLDC